MYKAKLLKHLKNDIYCRIGISKISGVGVIAIRDIPKGVDPFRNLSQEKERIIELNDNDLKNIDENVVTLIQDFFGSSGGKHDVLYSGPNDINISFYLNHSNNPNIDIVDKSGNKYLSFVTNRIIKKDEELTINYAEYDKI